jgi:hypothetical protein
MATLTGDKNTDYEVLYNLNDYDLGNMCKVNQYTRDLCKNDTFWMNRVMKRFIPIFGNLEEIKEYKEKYNFQSWRNYYIDLIDAIERYYENEILFEIRENQKDERRDDFMILIDYINMNTNINKYSDCYEKGECNLNWLKEDFINLNRIFYKIIYSYKLNKIQKFDLLLKILDSSSFNINGDNIEGYLNLFGEEGFNVLINKKNNIKVRNKIMSFIILSTNFNKYLNKLLPYIENSSEILKALFEQIKEGRGLEKEQIRLFLDAAVQKGATKMDIEEYYEASKGIGKDLQDDEEESYDQSMKFVKKYMKSAKESNKLEQIYAKLKSKKYSDKTYEKILKIL